MFDKMNGVGAHEMVIESPSHAASLIDLSERRIEDVLWACRERIVDLKRDHRLRYIVVFKNHGPAAGAVLEHSHCQLIALPVTPKRVREEIDGARAYFAFRERCVFCDILRQESNSSVRMVAETDHFAALEPYAPRFPFETWILPKDHNSHFEEEPPGNFSNLAWILKSTLRKLDKVLEQPAYNFAIHSSPVQEERTAHYHWHIEIMPRLTRVAGFEWATGFYINPTPPEEAAAFLREAGV
jgi:UDPglucose--hexose-1-phosphate uridylyltransferase